MSVSDKEERGEFEHYIDQSVEAAEGTAKFWSLKRLVSKVEPRDFIEEALAKYGHTGAIPPDEEKRIKRKLDCIILPLIGVCYALYVASSAISHQTFSYPQWRLQLLH